MMKRESMIAAVTSDIAGKVRGKAFPVSHWEKRLKRGVGWTPTNVQITCFDAIADSPYGALGDLLLVPDPDARVEVDFGDDSVPERFALGDILSLEGEPWECCTRSILKKALARLEGVGGVALKAAFEHEFHIMASQYAVGEAYTLSGYRAMAGFGETLMAALHTAGLSPDTLMKEYGAGQYEVTVDPSIGGTRGRRGCDPARTDPGDGDPLRRGGKLYPDPGSVGGRQRCAYSHESARQGRITGNPRSRRTGMACYRWRAVSWPAS